MLGRQLKLITTMKKLFLIVAAMFAAVSFSACSDDDDGGGNPLTEMRYVKEIRSSSQRGIESFEYDQQHRISKFTGYAGYIGYAGSWSFTYDGNTVNITANSTPFATLQLNNAGYAISGSSSDGDTIIFKYDGANGLISKTYSEYDAYTYRWNNGNRFLESSTVDPSSEYEYIQTYTSLKTPKCNFDFSQGMMGGGFFIPCLDGLFLGKQSTNLIEKVGTTGKSSQFTEGYRYSYKFNTDGYISQIIETWFATGENDEVTTYDITYY